MAAHGGRANWDQTRYITWKFFGRRLHVWDKWTGNVRVESKDLVILMNLNTREGSVFRNGEAITDVDTLREKLQFGYEAWVNDSYWMFLPFKLKDSGVTLKYIGEDTLRGGRPADVIQLTFEGVGVTPENKYHVYIDRQNQRLSQWDFFSSFSDDQPRFTTPWANWQKFGAILLSDDRGRNKHTDIAVFDSLPAKVFTSPAPFRPADRSSSAD